MFHKWDEPAQVFFLYCLPSYLMELLWISTQQGQKRSFPKPSISSAWILNCQTKVHFPLKQNETSSVEKCIHQPRYKITKNNYVSFNHCSFPGRSNKIPAQSDSFSYIYIYIYEIHTQKVNSWMKYQKYQLSTLRYANSRNVLLEKAGRIYMLEKNSFICIKSILKNNPCDQLTLRWDLPVRLKVKSKPLCVCVRVQLVEQHFVPAPSEWQRDPIPGLPIVTTKINRAE